MSMFEDECKEGVLHIEASTREFPTIAEMEVRTSTMQVKMTTGVVALAWNSSQEIPQQQENSCARVIDEELLFLASMSTARNCAPFLRTRDLRKGADSRLGPWSFLDSYRNRYGRWKSAKPRASLSPRQWCSRPFLPAIHYLNRPTLRH